MPLPTPGKPRLKLPRSRRLIRSGEFQELKNAGNRLVKGCLIVNWTVQSPPAHSKIGVITSRKVGNAVARARARRLMREVFRQHQYDFTAPLTMALVARRSITEKSFEGVERDFLFLLRQARLLPPK